MKIHELQVESHKNRKRVGRGISAGQGKTAGRGTKGQNSRTGKKLRAGFEGGQTPFMQRIPKKKGFKSIRVPAQVVYTNQLGDLGVTAIDNDVLAQKGLIATPYHLVKIIKKGELKKAVNVKVHAASDGAVEAIKTAGGTYEKVTVPVKKATAKSTEAKK